MLFSAGSPATDVAVFTRNAVCYRSIPGVGRTNQHWNQSCVRRQKGRESVKGCKRINQQKRGMTRQCWLIADRVDVVETPVESVPVAVGRSSSLAIAPYRPSWGSASYSGTSVCACRQARPPAVAVLARASGALARAVARSVEVQVVGKRMNEDAVSAAPRTLCNVEYQRER